MRIYETKKIEEPSVCQVLIAMKRIAQDLLLTARDDAMVILKAMTLISDECGDAHNMLADEYYKSAEWANAIAHFEKSSSNAPTYEKFFYLANSYKCLGDKRCAIKNFKKSLALHNYPEGLTNLAATYAEVNDHESELETLLKLTTDFPNYYLGFYNLGIHYYKTRNMKPSIESFKTSIKLNPDYKEAKIALSIAYLMNKNYADGFNLYESRWGVTPNCPIRDIKSPQWDGRVVAKSSSILITLEQGFGDTIQMSRYLLLLKEKFEMVSIEVQPAMNRLIEKAFPFVHTVIFGNQLPVTDYHCPVMSLPKAFGTTYKTIPSTFGYLKINSAIPTRFFKRSDIRKRIGICWSGSMDNAKMTHRSLTLKDVSPLISQDSYIWVSLVKEPRRSESGNITNNPSLRDYTSNLSDFFDTYRLMLELDVVVTVDTAVAHLAGAMGKATLLILNEGFDWRWHIDDNISSWYSSVRIVRTYEFSNAESLNNHILKLISAET